MKTPMEEFIEVLKIHRDTAFEKSRMYESEHYHSRGQAFDDAISFAEAHLEKEKGFIQKVYANAKATGEMDEAVRTFNTKEK